jgi:hypothetical protein
MDYPLITCDSYPIRYTAWENPKTWVKYTGPMENTTEKLIFSDKMKNPHYSSIEDGVYIEAGTHVGKAASYWLNCHFTAPSVARNQYNHVVNCANEAEVIVEAEKWLKKIYKMNEGRA